jgi:hypothetical protein
MGWATLWAIFSQTHLVTLVVAFGDAYHVVGLVWQIRARTVEQVPQCRDDRHQGCQMVCLYTKIPQLGYNLEGLVMENVGIFYGYLEY